MPSLSRNNLYGHQKEQSQNWNVGLDSWELGKERLLHRKTELEQEHFQFRGSTLNPYSA